MIKSHSYDLNIQFDKKYRCQRKSYDENWIKSELEHVAMRSTYIHMDWRRRRQRLLYRQWPIVEDKMERRRRRKKKRFVIILSSCRLPLGWATCVRIEKWEKWMWFHVLCMTDSLFSREWRAKKWHAKNIGKKKMPTQCRSHSLCVPSAKRRRCRYERRKLKTAGRVTIVQCGAVMPYTEMA